MTQLQFELICKIVESGAPALSTELCSALNDLVVDRNQLAKQVEELKLKQGKDEQVEHSKDVESSK